MVKATEGVLAVSFIGLSTVSVVFLSTVIASPPVTVIEAVSLGAGLLFIVGVFVSRHLILIAENGNGNGNENISNAPPTVDRRRIT